METHWLTAFLLTLLLIAVWTDLQRHRIPNIVSLGGIILGVVAHTWMDGYSGFLTGAGGVAVVAERDGEVVDVDTSRIVLKHDFSDSRFHQPVTIHNLSKFIRSNHTVCYDSINPVGIFMIPVITHFIRYI